MQRGVSFLNLIQYVYSFYFSFAEIFEKIFRLDVDVQRKKG